MTGWLRKQFGVGDAQEAAMQASGIAADAQREALDYLKQSEEVPMGIRDEALQELSGFYQAPGPQLTQDQLIEQAMSSPLYQSIMGNQQLGLDRILRRASARGGLRGGNVTADEFEFSTQLQNQALLESFNQAQQRQDYERALQLRGLEGLAGIQTNPAAVANLTSGIGATEAAGVTAAAQAKAQGQNNALNTLLGIGQTAAMFSDVRLKTDLEPIGWRDGYNWYRWRWNELAESMGLSGESIGLMAHEVAEQNPEAVTVRDGFLAIHYDMLEKH